MVDCPVMPSASSQAQTAVPYRTLHDLAYADLEEVLADSGVRSGLDVIRLLALGARGVLLGRAWAFALAAGGERSVSELIEMFAREIRVGMALTGVRTIAEIDRSVLASVPGDP